MDALRQRTRLTPALLGLLIIGKLLAQSAWGQSPGLPKPQYPQVAFSKPVGGQISETVVRHGGIDRRVIYRAPGNSKPGAKHPLLFVLHGFNSSIGAVVDNYARLASRADADGTILVFPVATGDPSRGTLAWNVLWPAGTLPSGTDKVDDVGFISRLIDVFIGTMNADAARVYVVGSSLGGSMSYTLSCHIADRLTAIVATHSQVTSILAAEFPKAAPLPVLIITGTADMTVPAAGFGAIVSTEQNIAYWKKRNGITAPPMEKSFDASIAGAFGDVPPLGVIQSSWPGPRGNELVWRKIVNGGHSMPGSEVIGAYDFLLRHARNR